MGPRIVPLAAVCSLPATLLAASVVSTIPTVGCGTKTVDEYVTPEQRGEALVSSPSLSTSRFNAFACTTCHAKVTPPAERTFPGAPLAGAVRRPSFWNGRVVTLGDAVDQCLTHFMKSKPLDRASATGKDLYAYLVSIADQSPDPRSKDKQPFTVVLGIADLPRGSSVRGAGVWSRACATCHGAIHTGVGRVQSPAGSTPASLVPEDTISEHAKAEVRAVTIEKIRHGSFLGYAGAMPPFSKETLSDGDVADLTAYIGVDDLK